MKKKIFTILFLTILLFGVVGCKKDNDKNGEELAQDLEIMAKNDDGTIKEGTLEGFHFVETEESSDRVKIEMADGSIILIVLSNKDTPITIANFKKLVSEKFYDNLTFHRVVEDFMIQGGDPTATGTGGSDDTIKGEFPLNGVENNLSHTRGVVSMARNSLDNDSASSQFFICTSDDYIMSLDGYYASFGKVFAGLDAVDHIAKTPVNGETPIDKPVIKTIRFITTKKA